jgi:hypothetical protein
MNAGRCSLEKTQHFFVLHVLVPLQIFADTYAKIFLTG